MPSASHQAHRPVLPLAVFARLPIAVAFVTGPDLVVEFANDRYLDLMGLDELVGQSLPAALPEVDGQCRFELLRQAQETGEPIWRHEMSGWVGHRRGRPEQVFVDAFCQPVLDDCGAMAGVLFFGANVTAQVLERRRKESLAGELAEVSDRYRTLFETLPFGAIRYSADGLIIEANPAASQITGLPADELLTWPMPPSLDAVCKDGLPLAELPVLEALRTGEVVAGVVMGIKHAQTGEPRWMEATAVPCWPDEAGRPQQAYAIFRDVTEQRRTSEILRGSAEMMERLREANVLGVIVVEQGRIIETNRAYQDILGYTGAELGTGRVSLTDLTPPEWVAVTRRAEEQLRRTGACEPFEKELVHRDGHRVPVLIGSAVIDTDPLRWTSIVVDLSARQNAEKERAALAARERAALAEAQLSRERLGLLVRAGELVGAATDRDELLSRATRLVVPALADICVTLLPDSEGTLRATSVAYRGPAGDAAAIDLRDFRIPDDGPMLVQAAWQTGRTQLGEVGQEQWAAAPRPYSPLHEIAARMDPQYLLAVPLMSGERPLGVISMARAAGRPRFLEGSDIPVAEELGRQLAAGLANADRFTWDHEVAAALQRAVLPDSLPSIAGLDLAVRYLPTTVGADVGGDWYDVFDLGGGLAGLAVGDVVGHNIAAASVMGQVRNLLRAYALDKDDPAAVLAATDAALRRLLPDALATAMYAVLDPAAGRLEYACAGHLPPVCVTASGHVSYLDTTSGGMLGLGGGFATECRTLDQGSTLLFYTDGLIEDRNRDLAEGLTELSRVMSLGGGRTAEQTCTAVLATMVGTALRPDDLCMLAARLTA